MSRHFLHLRLRLMGAFGLLMSLVWVSQAYAGSLQISPAYVDYSVKPGDTIEYTLQVKNVGTDALDIVSDISDFYYNETGEKVFIEDDAAPGEERFSLKEWVTMDVAEAFTLEPGEAQKVPISIAVPEDAEPGGHYGVLFVSMVPAGSASQGGAQIGVSGRLGSLILIDVPGFIVRDAEIGSFKTGMLEGDLGEERFIDQSSFESGPVSFAISYHNKGTTHFYPEGTVTVKGGYKKEEWVVPLQPVSESEKIRALPRVTKDFFGTLNQRKLFGKYTATLAMEDGDGDQLPEQTVEFWVMPLKTVLFWGLLVIVGLILLTVLVKRYNRWISSRAVQRQ